MNPYAQLCELSNSSGYVWTSHLLSPPHSSPSLFLSLFLLAFIFLEISPRRYRQSGFFFSTVILKQYPHKALAAWPNSMPSVPKWSLVFTKITSGPVICKRRCRFQAAKLYTVALAFPGHIVMITRVGWWLRFYAKTVAPFSVALRLWRKKRELFCPSHCGIKLLLPFLSEICYRWAW